MAGGCVVVVNSKRHGTTHNPHMHTPLPKCAPARFSPRPPKFCDSTRTVHSWLSKTHFPPPPEVHLHVPRRLLACQSLKLVGLLDVTRDAYLGSVLNLRHQFGHGGVVPRPVGKEDTCPTPTPNQMDRTTLDVEVIPGISPSRKKLK